MEKRIAVTGIGVMTSIGLKKDEFWNALCSGRSGVGTIRAFDPSGHRSRIASEVTGFDPSDYFERKLIKRMARVSQFAVAAAVEAVRDAGLELSKEDLLRTGCVVGSAAGDYMNIEEQHEKFLKKGPRTVNPFSVPKIIPNMPASNVSIVLGLTGPDFAVLSACATGTHSIGTAMDIIRSGRADVMIAGGAEATITPLVVDAYASMGVLSCRNAQPARASRPFDAARDGFVIGEGAGVLVLESVEHAVSRGAHVLAYLSGFGMTSDAYNIVLPEPGGISQSAAIELALKDAGLNKEDIGYINAHGTSTRANDKVETAVIKRVFGIRSKKIPVSSTKSMIGHTLGAAGGIEAAATVMTVSSGMIHPTINLDEPDPECDLDYVPHKMRKARVEHAISSSFGFGGQNGVLVFSKA